MYRRNIYKLGKDLNAVCVYKMEIIYHVYHYIVFCASIKENPLEWEMPTCSNILAWKIPWTNEPGRI